MKGILRTLKMARIYWKPAAGAFLALIVVNGSNLITPQLLRLLIDQGITGKQMQIVWTMAILLIVFALLRGGLTFCKAIGLKK